MSNASNASSTTNLITIKRAIDSDDEARIEPEPHPDADDFDKIRSLRELLHRQAPRPTRAISNGRKTRDIKTLMTTTTTTKMNDADNETTPDGNDTEDGAPRRPSMTPALYAQGAHAQPRRRSRLTRVRWSTDEDQMLRDLSLSAASAQLPHRTARAVKERMQLVRKRDQSPSALLVRACARCGAAMPAAKQRGLCYACAAKEREKSNSNGDRNHEMGRGKRKIRSSTAVPAARRDDVVDDDDDDYVGNVARVGRQRRDSDVTRKLRMRRSRGGMGGSDDDTDGGADDVDAGSCDSVDGFSIWLTRDVDEIE
jgi:hypothetical protein